MSAASRSASFSKRVTTTGVSVSDWVIIPKGGAGIISLQVEASGSATVTLQGTLNIELTAPTGTVPAAEINDIQDMTAIASNGLYTIQGPLKAIRINQVSGAGTSAITVLQSEGS